MNELIILSLSSSAISLISTITLPAKRDSDVMFCLTKIKGLIIDRSLVN